MAYVQCVSPCIRCRRVISYNPMLVPSIRLTPDGPREPLCEACVAALNAVRVAAGFEPWPPIKEGAYEPCDESEVVFPED